jgi:2-dehydropantoate 2-reductase
VPARQEPAGGYRSARGEEADRVRWSIVGAGAMGTLLAAHLARIGEDVLLLGRRPESLRTHLQVTAGTPPAVATWSARVAVAVLGAPVRAADVVVVLVKAPDTAAVAAHLPGLLDAGGMVLTLQNGLGAQAILAEALGADRVLVGSTAQGATLLAPGQVRHAGAGDTLLGWAAGQGPVTPPARVAGMLTQAGWVATVVPDMAPVLWGKLAVNCAINPLTGLLNVTNGELLAVPGARELMRAAAYEVAAVARAQGIELEGDPAARAEAVAQATGANRSSLLQDLDRGRTTEIDFISGTVVQAAERVGVGAPINRELWRRVRALEGRPLPA